MDGTPEATLERVPRIRCPVQFWDENDTQALLDFASEVNAMNPAAKLGLLVRKTEIGAQKVNGSCTSSVHPVPYHLPRKICAGST